MNLVSVFFWILVAGMALLPFLKGKGQKWAMVTVMLSLALLSALPAVEALTGKSSEWVYPGNAITGPVPLRLDALSGWFILIISFLFLTGLFYGFYYLKPHAARHRNLTFHYMAYLLLYGSLTSLCVVQNSLVFLTVWEVMTLAALAVVIFEHEKEATVQAGINFLIQSHVSVLFLTAGFLWAAIRSGSYDFAGMARATAGSPEAVPVMLMLCLFTGFGIKAGFVPFHTWLPYAHPAAPAHISGIMSGIIIKAGIFGILRMLMVIPADYTTLGYIILAVASASGLYGVMLAIVQHNLKKLLAYHSVENIGIIGIGIGIGCIGLGNGNQTMAMLGFAGALLHTLNHALFKSLLFYAAGIVYRSAHTLDTGHLGGLIKKMPQTAALFLVAAIAISGIPPFNGFISEFILYTGLYQWLINASLLPSMAALIVILALVLTGGLALLCFTKAFGIVFLGSARKVSGHEIAEPGFRQLIPLYLTALLIALIGVFPQFFFGVTLAPARLLAGTAAPGTISPGRDFTDLLQTVSLAMWGLIFLSGLLFFIRKLALRNRTLSVGPTWGCGYGAPNPKMQYTAASFVRSYRKLNSPLLLFSQKKKEIDTLFPEHAAYESHAGDKIEKWLIDKPLQALKAFLGRFLFFQNGRLQSYLLYGILYVLLLILVPLVIDKLKVFAGILTKWQP